MVNDKTILTVSYGAFSCTLEGFEDPLAAMKDVVAYFRDLSVEDERFGAGPLASGSGLLPYLAAQGHTGPIDAEAAMGGLRLRRVSDPADADAYDDEDETPARGPAVAFAGTAPESVAAKLARIRGVVARSRGGLVGATFADTVPPVAASANEPAEAGDDEQAAIGAPEQEAAVPGHVDHDDTTDLAADAPQPDLAAEEFVEDAADEVVEVAPESTDEDLVTAEEPGEDTIEDSDQATWDVPPEDESDVADLATLDAAPHDLPDEPAEADDLAEPETATEAQDSPADEPAEAPDELAALIARLNREAAASAEVEADEDQPAPADDDAPHAADEDTPVAAAADTDADHAAPQDESAETDDDGLQLADAAVEPADPETLETADDDTAEFTGDADEIAADFAGRPMARIVVMRKVDHDAAIATGRLDPTAAVTDADNEPDEAQTDAIEETSGHDGTEVFRLDRSARVDDEDAPAVDADAAEADDPQADDAGFEAVAETDPEPATDSDDPEAAEDTDGSLLLDAGMAVAEDEDSASPDEAAAEAPTEEADVAAWEAGHTDGEDTGGSLLLEPAMAVGENDDDAESDEIASGADAAETAEAEAADAEVTPHDAEETDAALVADADPSTVETDDTAMAPDSATETDAAESAAAEVQDAGEDTPGGAEETDAAHLSDADPATDQTGDAEETDAAHLADADPATAEGHDDANRDDETAERAPDRSPARGGATSALPTGDEAVDRILAETNHQLEDSESSRRRNAIAHLKAAVAAARAAPTRDRDAKVVEPSGPEVQFRDDLARVVRPRRPPEGVTTPRRMPPLLLVSEQRIDVPEQEPPPVSDHPVRPRRVSTHQIELEPEAEVEAEVSGPGFAEFAESVGARELPDIMEAAASYYAFVEGQPHFSRPQIMKTAAEAARDEATREDQLRSFGILLRQGRIQKLQRGQFAVTDKTRFRPERRHVGE